ncbi:hypothetical protein CIW54_07470 [Paraburkholderia sp. T12-10]|nr:hypothetical protein CIW54_07470 [Paraburkholderia sp. T12-10]
MSTQEQRERFEKHAIKAGWAFRDMNGLWEFGGYSLYQLWTAWQAAEAAAIERCAKRVERELLDLFGMPTEMRITARAHVADDLRALLPKEES